MTQLDAYLARAKQAGFPASTLSAWRKDGKVPVNTKTLLDNLLTIEAEQANAMQYISDLETTIKTLRRL